MRHLGSGAGRPPYARTGASRRGGTPCNLGRDVSRRSEVCPKVRKCARRPDGSQMAIIDRSSSATPPRQARLALRPARARSMCCRLDDDPAPAALLNLILQTSVDRHSDTSCALDVQGLGRSFRRVASAFPFARHRFISTPGPRRRSVVQSTGPGGRQVRRPACCFCPSRGSRRRPCSEPADSPLVHTSAFSTSAGRTL